MHDAAHHHHQGDIMTRTIVALLAVFAAWSTAVAQSHDNGPEPLRDVSVAVDVGCMQLLGAAISLQFSDRWALGLVGSWFVLGGSGGFLPEGAVGVGVRGSYYFSRDGRDTFLWSNVIAADVQYLLPKRDGPGLSASNPGGIGVEVIVGRDGIIGPGIGITWGVGVAASFHGEAPPLILPAGKIGFHIDF
jgi:hypothetical protein